MCAIWSTLLPVLGRLGGYKSSSVKWSETLEHTGWCMVSQSQSVNFGVKTFVQIYLYYIVRVAIIYLFLKYLKTVIVYLNT